MSEQPAAVQVSPPTTAPPTPANIPTETVETVFGNKASGIKALIPTRVWEVLSGDVTKLKLQSQGDLIKQQFVEILNNPAIRLQRAAALGDDTKTEKVWLGVAIALRARLSGNFFGPKSHPCLVIPVSIGKVFQSKEKEDKTKTAAPAGTPAAPPVPQPWYYSMDALVTSRDAEAPLKGPGSVGVYGFPTERDAIAGAQKMVAGKPYIMQLRFVKDSPTGELSPGQFARLNGNWNDTVIEGKPEDNGFTPEALFNAYASGLTPVSGRELWGKPTARQKYLLRGMSVVRGTVSASAKGTFGTLVLMDDTMYADEERMKKENGGVSVFLSRDHIALGRLAQGSTVDIIVSGSETDEKDVKTKLPTGNKRWTFNEVAIAVTLDLGGVMSGSPNPEGVAARLPAPPVSTGPEVGQF